ncbi:MAG: hypothetical protein WC476_00915 [Phycisphaerae bacterium]|jgi:hypothetical protein
MNPTEIIGIGVAGILFFIGILRTAFPNIPSKFIPLISFILGIGLAVAVGLTNHVNIITLILSGLLPALGASGTHSTYNTLTSKDGTVVAAPSNPQIPASTVE